MSYATNLTENQWRVIKNIVENKERRRKYSLAGIVDGILYLVKTGCQWRMLPSDFAPRKSVYYYFTKWKQEGIFEELLTVLRNRVRISVGRDKSPSLGIIDSRSVKTSHHVDSDRGIDSNRKIKGRKQHLVIDTLREFGLISPQLYLICFFYLVSLYGFGVIFKEAIRPQCSDHIHEEIVDGTMS